MAEETGIARRCFRIIVTKTENEEVDDDLQQEFRKDLLSGIEKPTVENFLLPIIFTKLVKRSSSSEIKKYIKTSHSITTESKKNTPYKEVKDDILGIAQGSKAPGNKKFSQKGASCTCSIIF